MPRAALALLLFSMLNSATAGAADVIPHRQDRLPNQPYSPEEAIRAMTVPPGFTVELVASEPDIVNPIAMTFDDRGRIWVTESLEYPRKSAGPGRDRVKILEDTDGDGRADRFTVFASDLNIPTGVAVGHGRVWVLNSPDLLSLTEKDGKAASREVAVTGFGRADTHELPSTLTWGPDGWLYGFNGVFNPSHISSQGKDWQFTCALWRFHPRARKFEVFAEGTSNPYGLAWDTEGSAIVEACHWANDHLFHFVETGYYQRQAGPYPPYTLRLGSITDHGHQKTAYCGLAFFDSDAYPGQYRERLFTGNIHGNCINTDRLRRDGSTYIASEEPDFLSAHDAWFMPVAQKVGPDGCLYILDWYDRYHCYQDANRDPEGIDRLKGRLYRVRYKDSPRAPKFDLAAESDEQLIQRLSSPNIYFRESAQRLLSERNTDAVRARLCALALDRTAAPKTRLHALWALVGGGDLDPSFHMQVLQDPDAAVRAWGVRAAGNAGRVDAEVRTAITRLASDPSPDVQLQVAIAARKVKGLDALALLVEIASACGQDKLIPAIVWTNLHPLLPAEKTRFAALVARSDLKNAPGLAKLLPRTVDRLLGEGTADGASVRSLLEQLAACDASSIQEALSVVSERFPSLAPAAQDVLRQALDPLADRLLQTNTEGPLSFSAQLLASQFRKTLMDASAVPKRFLDQKQPDTVRLQALDALVQFKDAALLDSLGRSLNSDTPAFLAKVFTRLGKCDDKRVGGVILAAYPRLAPELQPLSIDLLLERMPWTRMLLDAVQKGRLPRDTLTANHLRRILESNDREAVWAVEKTWGNVRSERNPERERVVAEMGQWLKEHPGDPQQGARVFRNLCTQCHTLHGEGTKLGPDLTSNGRASFDQLVSNVFDPSLVIGQPYQATTVFTNDERALTGIVSEDSPERIVLDLPGGGRETIPRGEVKYMRTSKLSMMPEGIENAFSRKELADLFAYLSFDRPPSDPKAQLIPGAPVPRSNAVAR
jgi:putative heme-binding domain-containing protein